MAPANPRPDAHDRYCARLGFDSSDGTIVPWAAAGSLPLLLRECVRYLRTVWGRFGDRPWSRYGFSDAFNAARGWYAPDVIGIDTGVSLLMAENARTGFVWRTFMRNPEAGRAMTFADFRERVSE